MLLRGCHIFAEAPDIFAVKILSMEQIQTKLPDFENKVYILGGPRQQALEEAMEIILRTIDRCGVCVELFCEKDTRETIETMFNRLAAAPNHRGELDFVYYTTIKNGNVEAISDRIWASHSRRFVRLTLIDSLEYLHSRGKKHDREEVLKKIARCNPVVVVSDELAPTGTGSGQWNVNGTTLSLSIWD